MEILNQIPITEMAKDYKIACIVLGIIAAVTAVIVLCSDIHSKAFPIAAISSIVLLICTFVIGITAPQVDTGRNKYEVTIDDSISVNEMFEKYDIIEQRGKIWIIEDKERAE